MKNTILISTSLFVILFSCMNPENTSSDIHKDEPPNYEEIGFKYAMLVKGILGKNLIGAVQNTGTEYAVTMCNTRAVVLEDSLSNSLNTSIKR